MLKILVLFAALSVAAPSLAEEASAVAPVPISIGQTHLVEYAPGDQRQINVYLPDGYAAGDERYPVLYLIDGGLGQDFLHVAGTTALNATLGRSQPVIVVGIETKDRRAELIGSPGMGEEARLFPSAGKAAGFRTWIRDTVKPMVEAAYRTNGNDAVLGESAAGLFIVETWLTEPAMFDRYAAINPSLWWNQSALAKSAADTVRQGPPRGGLLISVSNEGPQTTKAVELVAAAAGQNGCYLATPELTHATAYHILTPQALQYLFPTDNKFESELGFEVKCSKKF